MLKIDTYRFKQRLKSLEFVENGSCTFFRLKMTDLDVKAVPLFSTEFLKTKKQIVSKNVMIHKRFHKTKEM